MRGDLDGAIPHVGADVPIYALLPISAGGGVGFHGRTPLSCMRSGCWRGDQATGRRQYSSEGATITTGTEQQPCCESAAHVSVVPQNGTGKVFGATENDNNNSNTNNSNNNMDKYSKMNEKKHMNNKKYNKYVFN